MSVPAALKSVPALTSFGVLGTGAVGVGGGQLIEGMGTTFRALPTYLLIFLFTSSIPGGDMTANFNVKND